MTSNSSKRAELEPGVVRGEFFTPLPDGRLRCDMCPRLCTLHEGQRAFCFVRQARRGEVVLTSYGRSTGFCIDPIEKKPLNHFYPGSSVLSFGTAGCNLGCRFCQNWDISKAREIKRLSERAYPDDVAEAARQAGCTSVAFTYNDPVIFHEYAVDTAKACRERGLKAVAVSAGYVTPQARRAFYAHMDAANIDLKAFTERFYHKVCFGHLEPVLDTLRYLKHETCVWFEVTTLLIPGENDSLDEVARLSEWMLQNLGPEVPLHFTAFHPDFKMTQVQRTPSITLTQARERAREIGLRFVYTGNVHDPGGQTTYCPGCAAPIVGRDGYDITVWAIADGRCTQCCAAIPGYFVERPGAWGSRRASVHLRTWTDAGVT